MIEPERTIILDREGHAAVKMYDFTEAHAAEWAHTLAERYRLSIVRFDGYWIVTDRKELWDMFRAID